MAVRFNILNNSAARDKYIQGVKLLKKEIPGPTTTSLGIAGPSQQVSTYDLFVVWHHLAMSTFTPPSQGDRNAAHRGPVFLPWHRFMLLQTKDIRRLGSRLYGRKRKSGGDRPIRIQRR